MRKLLLALLLLAGSAHANIVIPVGITPSAINLVCMPTRQSGTAPLAVVFSAVGTTSPGVTTQPFHDIRYTWSFGDAGAGTWTTGAGGNTSKNSASGPVAGHVFETAGTYTVTCTAFDGTNTATRSIQVVVTSANDAYNQANTKCYYQTSPSGDCPNDGTEAQSTDFHAALTACVGTGKRCLFQRGSTFPRSAQYNLGAFTGWTVGAYGTGAKPVSTGTSITPINFNNAGASDGRVLDLDIVGNGSGDTGLCLNFGARVGYMLVARMTCRDLGKGYSVSSVAEMMDASVFYENQVYDYRRSGGSAFFGYARRSAFLGNELGPVPLSTTGLFQTCDEGSPVNCGEHVLRIQVSKSVAVTNNTLSYPNYTKGSLEIRAGVRAGDNNNDSQHIYVGDNKLTGNANVWTSHLGPSSDSENAFIYDAIFDGNWYVAGSATTIHLSMLGDNVTVRNNIFDLSSAASGATAVAFNSQSSTGRFSSGNFLYNNTCYTSSAIAAMRCFHLGGLTNPVVNTTIKNNLGYAPNVTTPVLVLTQGSVSGTVGGQGSEGNSSDVQIKTIDPLFTGVSPFTPANAKPTAGSYAINGGTSVPVWSDFGLNAITGTREIGAWQSP